MYPGDPFLWCAPAVRGARLMHAKSFTPGTLFWCAWAIALALNLTLAALLPGTSDVQFYAEYGQTYARFGVARAYASNEIFNIPPMAAAFSGLLASAFGPGSMVFAFFLRLPGILAESVLAIVLWRQRRCSAAVAALFVLNPLSVAINGYHGNLDGLMAVFIGASLLAAASQRPVACGLWLGLAANLKVAPVLLGPAFLLWWLSRDAAPGLTGRRAALRFSLACAAVVLAGWSPALIACPALFAHRVLAYSSIWGQWGVSRLLYLTGSENFHTITYGAPSPLAGTISSILKIIVIAVATTLAWRRRRLNATGLCATIAATWVLFLVLTPAAAPQYLIWPLLPLLLSHPRLGFTYAFAAVPALALYYSPLTAFLLPANPLPTLAAHVPWLSGPQAWTWPALLLWAYLLGVLVCQFPTWYRARNLDLAELPALESVDASTK